MRKIYSFIFAFAFLMLMSLNCLAASIAAIEVKGNSLTSTETILATIKSKKGESYSREKTQQDIKELWKLGQFQEIQIEKKEIGVGVVLTFIVEEKPIITKISFEGNKKIKKEDLEKDITIHTYRPLDEKQLTESVSKIKAAYSEKGYYLADVEYEVKTESDGNATLVFHVFENKGAVIRKIEFIGNHAFKDKDLKKIIKTKEKSAFSWLSGGGKYKEDQLDTDVMMLQFYYMNNGYLKAKVDTPKVAITKDKRYIFVTFMVEEGKQYKISDIDVEGDILTTKEELKTLIKSKSKEIYNQKTIEEDIMRIVDFYGESGYAFVNIRPKTEPNDEDLTT